MCVKGWKGKCKWAKWHHATAMIPVAHPPGKISGMTWSGFEVVCAVQRVEMMVQKGVAVCFLCILQLGGTLCFQRGLSTRLRLGVGLKATKEVSALANGMSYRTIPNSGLSVSALGLGTMNFGEQLTRTSSLKLLDEAVNDYGINFIDTAEVYPAPYKASTAGKSERIIGDWLRQHKPTSATGSPSSQVASSFRESVVISTMICGRSSSIDWCRADGSPTRLTPKQIVEAVDAQLARLGTDYIDLLQFHWPDRNYHVPLHGPPYRDNAMAADATPISEQLEAVAGLIQAGKVRYFGLSNETPYGVTSFLREAEYKSLPRPVALQNTLNLLEGHNELDMGLREVCAPENGNLGFIAHTPLAGGALTGKYLDFKSAPRTARMCEYVGFMHRYISAPATEAVRAYQEVVDEFALPLAPVALAWAASQPGVTSTLLGASSSQQLRENVQALNLAPLAGALLEAINAVRRRYVDPAKGVFTILDPKREYVDPSKLPWGSRDQDVDPELDLLVNSRR